jgi:hypothetical protein
VELGQGEAHGIGIVLNVGAVFVVIAVRDLAANFMQLGRPVQFSAQTLIGQVRSRVLWRQISLKLRK